MSVPYNQPTNPAALLNALLISTGPNDYTRVVKHAPILHLVKNKRGIVESKDIVVEPCLASHKAIMFLSLITGNVYGLNIFDGNFNGWLACIKKEATVKLPNYHVGIGLWLLTRTNNMTTGWEEMYPLKKKKRIKD
jgi:hypothetical protein